MKTGMFIFTDGRMEFLKRTLASFQANLIGEISSVIMHDDSDNQHYAASLERQFVDFRGVPVQHMHHESRLGFGGSISRAWETAPALIDCWIHLEDDFLLNGPLELRYILTILQANPHLAQICLLRQPWNDRESAAGGIWQQFPEAFTERETNGQKWLEHQKWFSTNVCVYPKWVMQVGWPEGQYSEGMFGFKLFEKHPAARCAYYGAKTDPPRITHIGVGRVGTGY